MIINEALARLLPIAKTNAVTPFSGVVAIREERIECYDGRMFVSIPVPVKANICVDATALAKAAKADTIYDVQEEVVIVKNGRFRLTLKMLDKDLVPQYEPHDNLEALPEGCLQDLMRARRFVSENNAHGWATSVVAKDSVLLATNNVVLSRTDLQHPCPIQGLIPSYLIDYIMSNAASGAEYPVKAGGDENAVTVMWSDGAYVRAQRVIGQAHEQMFVIADSLQPLGESALVDDEWRRAYEQVLQFAEATIVVHERQIGISRADLDAMGEVEQDLGSAVLDPRYFTPVLEESSHIELSPHPARSYWSGDRIVGLIVGRAA